MHLIAVTLMLALSPIAASGQHSDPEWTDRTVELLKQPGRHGDQLTLLALCLQGYFGIGNLFQENENILTWADMMSNDLIAVALDTYSAGELTQELETLEHSAKILNLIGELMYSVSRNSVTSVLYDYCDILVYGSVDGAPDMPSPLESTE